MAPMPARMGSGKTAPAAGRAPHPAAWADRQVVHRRRHGFRRDVDRPVFVDPPGLDAEIARDELEGGVGRVGRRWRNGEPGDRLIIRRCEELRDGALQPVDQRLLIDDESVERIARQVAALAACDGARTLYPGPIGVGDRDYLAALGAKSQDSRL